MVQGLGFREISTLRNRSWFMQLSDLTLRALVGDRVCGIAASHVSSQFPRQSVAWLFPEGPGHRPSDQRLQGALSSRV